MSCSTRPLSGIVVAGALLAALGSSSAGAARDHAAQSAAARPSGFVRACGTIEVGERRLHVDVAEGDGALVTCRHARRVGAAFLRDRRSHHVRVAGHRWSCWTARQNGVGWAYHCLRHDGDDRYVDVGVDRRW